MSGELKLELLGSVSITLGGKALGGLRYAKSVALLGFLAVTGRPHSREALATLLWGGSADKEARASLRGVLSKLARALPQHIVLSQDRVAFNRESPYFLDVEAFLAKLAAADAAALGEAVALYRGELLEGLRVHDAPEFEEWLLVERERLRHLMLGTLHALAVHHAEREEHAAGITYVRHLLELEPWREDAHRQLMLMLASSGQKEAALAHYQSCRRVLAGELGLEPSAETFGLYKSIEAGELAPQRPLRHNLPLAPLPLLGREAELADLVPLLAGPDCRLLTLSGPGGVGKTRLALELAWKALEDGSEVRFVELAAVTEPERVLTELAQTLEVPESGPLLNTLKETLRDRRLLLLLDNFEQVVSAAPLVVDLLASCSGLKVLATSREGLRLRGEREFVVPPLALPDPARLPDLATLRELPSVALFESRAQAVRSDFAVTEENAAAIAMICVRLDGLPLALELAAARSKLLSPGVLLTHLTSRLKLLTHGARDLPERHQTLRATLAWSYELLDEADKRLFRRLGVFVGGASLEAVKAVGGEDGGEPLEHLSSLLSKSLLTRLEGRDGEARFAMLETLREYALERLRDHDEEAALRRAHGRYYLSLAEAAEPGLQGPEQVTWLAHLEAEYDDLRAALRWALAADADTALRLAGALPWFWYMQGLFNEGRDFLERALALETSGGPRAKALAGAGLLARRQGEQRRAISFLEESLVLYREQGDETGVAAALHQLAHVAEESGDYLGATSLFEESLALSKAAGDAWGIPLSLTCLAHAAHRYGDDLYAAALLEESLPLSRALGNKHVTSDALYLLGLISYPEDPRRAVALFEESLAQFRALGDKQGTGLLLNALGLAALQEDDTGRAEALFKECLSLQRAQGDRQGVAYSLENLALLAAAQEQVERAARLGGAAKALKGGVAGPASPFEPSFLRGERAALRDRLSATGFAWAWTEGRAMGLEEAVDFALQGGLPDSISPLVLGRT